MEELGGEYYSIPVQKITIFVDKESCGETLELSSGLNKASFDAPSSFSLPAVRFMYSELNYVADSRFRKNELPPQKPKVVVEPVGLYNFLEAGEETGDDSTMEDDVVFADDKVQGNFGMESPGGHLSETEPSLHSFDDIIWYDQVASCFLQTLYFLPPTMFLTLLLPLTLMSLRLLRSQRALRSIRFATPAERS